MSRVQSWWWRARRTVLRHRRLLAAGLTAAAVLAGLRVTHPMQPDTVEVLVAAHDLAAGSVASRTDLVTARWPADQVPDGVLDPTGLRLTAAVRAGEPIVDTRVLGPETMAGFAHTGRTSVPVRLPDVGVVALLRPGMQVDLWATDPGSGEVTRVADDALVVTVPDVPEGGAAGLGGGLAVLAVSALEVPGVAAASARLYTSVTFVG